MNRACFTRGLKIAVLVAAAVAGFSFVVMSLWNWLMPALFGWRAIGFLEAVGLLVLSRILFGGWRGRAGHGMHWRARMAERWERMTPEERETFRQGMRGCCGRSGPPPSGPNE